MPEEVTPINRMEAIMSGEEITPLNRMEAIMSGQDITPITREEYFVKEYAEGHGGGGGLPLSTTTVTANIVRGTFVGSASIDLAFPIYQSAAEPPRLDVSTGASMASNKTEMTQNFAGTLFPCMIRPIGRTSGLSLAITNLVGCTLVANFLTINSENASFTVTLNAS